MSIRTPPHRSFRSARPPAPVALAALAAIVLGASAGCDGGGAESPPEQVVPTPSAPVSTFDTGFRVRQDVQLSMGGVTDAEVVDLDGDGISDLVETDFIERRVSAALGNADGSFTPIFELDTPGTPWNVESGDVTGDGELDLVVISNVANGGVSSISVFRGTGGGAFAVDASATLPGEPIDLAVGVLPGTSKAQILVAIPSAGTFHFEHTGPGTLSKVRELPRSGVGYRPLTVTTIDVDGDGLDDVLVGEIGEGTAPDRLTAFLADGSGNLVGPTVHANVLDPLVDNAGDIDGDGRDDLVVAQLGSDLSLVSLGGPTGLGAPLLLDFAGAASSILFDDLDGDGWIDAAATLIEDDAISVRYGTAPMTFGAVQLFGVGEAPRWIGSGVFGDEPHRDLVCANIRDVSILHGTGLLGAGLAGVGASPLRGASGIPIGDDPQFLRVVDMDLDGTLDAVTIDRFQDNVVFLRGTGDGTFVNQGEIPLPAATVETAGYLLIEDFDSDGRPDVATTVYAASSVQLMPNPDVLAVDAPTPQAATVVGSEPLGLDSGDIDGDGKLDILVANSGDETIQTLLGRGDFTFQTKTPVPVPFRPIVVLLADWNLSGTLDAVAITGKEDGTESFLLVLEGDGSGDLRLESVQTAPQVASVLTLADFDEDGFHDFAASHPRQTSDKVHVMLNRGNFQFLVETVQVGFRMGGLEVTDLDRDGHLDLAVPLKDGQLFLALGDGTGHFPTRLPPPGEQFPAPAGVTTTVFADLNGDGLADLLSVSPRSPNLWVALNEGRLFD